MNFKKLMEKRAALQEEMNNILAGAETENRAINDDEKTRFDACEQEIRSIDETIARADKARNIQTVAAPAAGEPENRAEAEERAFVEYVTGKAMELRSGEQNMNMTNGAPLIPTSISEKIIKKVKELCPILAGCTMYSVKGTLKVPVWGKANTTHDINVAYATEFTEITADSGAFTSVDLGGYLVGALTLVGRSVENNAVFSVVDFIVDQMAEEIAAFLDKELLNGTTNKATGALSTTNTMNAGSTTAISADNLIDLQAKVKTAYQANACWTMAPATFTAIKKLKDGNNRYLLQDNVAGEFPYMLLGKPVYLSENMPAIASGAKAVLYGDYSGLSCNMRENIGIEVLREKYATQHAIGVISWLEFDSKVTDNDRLATLVMSTSTT